VPINHALCNPGSSISLKTGIRRVSTNYYLLVISRPFYKISCGCFGGCPNKSRVYIRTSRLCDSGNGRGYSNPNHSGGSFLATAGCRIDVKDCTLTFDVGDVHVDFNLLKVAKCPSISDECHKIDVVDSLI